MASLVQQTERITPLSRPTSRALRSTLIIPTYTSVLQELVHNSLDARATRIYVWVDATPGEVKIRVEDDGWGMSESDLKRVGARYETSNNVNTLLLGSVASYGFRGEALSSISALGLVDITTRRRGARQSLSKVIKGSMVLNEGVAARSIAEPNGTVVIVKDLFYNVPVRQSAMTSYDPISTLSACKKVVETLSLVRPNVKWALWTESNGGFSSAGTRKLIGIDNARDSLDVFRTLYGTKSTERVQTVRATAGKRKVDGFIGLHGVVNTNHQHIYVNSIPLERGEIHDAISKRFASSRFSVVATQGEAFFGRENKQSPRKLERYPIYVLNLTLPRSEIAVTCAPLQTRLGYKDNDAVFSFFLAVVDEFLSRHGFTFGQELGNTVSPSEMVPARFLIEDSMRRASPTVLPVYRESEGSVSVSLVTKPMLKSGRDSLQGKEDDRQWLEGVLRRRFSSRTLVRPSHGKPATVGKVDLFLHGHHEFRADLAFSAACLDDIQMLEHVDRKFLACVLLSDCSEARASQPTLVLIDQHAADERVAVESIVAELCKGFLSQRMPTSKVEGTPITIILTREEVDILRRPGVLGIFERWGIILKPAAGELSFSRVTVTEVPTLLASRLLRKEMKEVRRLVQLYVLVLEHSLSELQCLLREAEKQDVDWGRALRWMPKAMRELANSKACRGAIMFGDKLDHDQCQRLVSGLRATRQPFICAHGRPSLVPLIALDGNVPTKRRLDWTRWRE